LGMKLLRVIWQTRVLHILIWKQKCRCIQNSGNSEISCFKHLLSSLSVTWQRIPHTMQQTQTASSTSFIYIKHTCTLCTSGWCMLWSVNLCWCRFLLMYAVRCKSLLFFGTHRCSWAFLTMGVLRMPKDAPLTLPTQWSSWPVTSEQSTS
jgi:hypothetical protein